MCANLHRIRALVPEFTAVFSLLTLVSVIAHAHSSENQPGILNRPIRARQSKWLRDSADPVPYHGYTSPDWRRSIHDKNCTDALLFQDVRIVGDDSCAVSNALFLLLRQSFRFNMHKWAEDMSGAVFRINRTMYAHEIVPSGSRRNFVLQYEQPSTSCLVWASNVTNTSQSSIISSVTVFEADSHGVTFALFSAPTQSSAFLQARVNDVKKSVSLSIVNATGLHRLKNHSPSAAFLPSENLAVANLGRVDYDVNLYARKGDEYIDLKMQSPFRVGGENIGSLFRSGSSLYMSARFNVPYVPLDMGGHGYRSIGLYNITSAPIDPRSDLIDWLSPDACISGCLNDLHETCGEVFLLNATSLIRCLPRSGLNIHHNSGYVLENVYAPCLLNALNMSNTSSPCMRARKESLVDGLLCAQRCRSGNQIYMPAISPMKGSWYGVVGRTSYEAVETGKKYHSEGSNPLYLCRLSKSFAWNPSCFDENAALMHDLNGNFGHPLTSQIVDFNGNVLLATVANRGSKLIGKDRCMTYLHSWPTSNFSYFGATEEASDSFKVALPNVALPDNLQVNVLYGFQKSAAPCSESIILQAFHQKQCRTARIGGNIFPNNTGDVRFQVGCDPKDTTVDLHIHVPSSCRLHGVGP